MDDASLESRVGTAEIANQCSCLPKGTRQAAEEGKRKQGGGEETLSWQSIKVTSQFAALFIVVALVVIRHIVTYDLK